jgi:hypothetical protein
MSISYKNVVTRLDVDPNNSDVVAEIVGYLHGRDSVTDNSYTCAFIVPLETEEEISNFIQYEDLTSEVVAQWVTGRIGEKDLNRMKKSINDKLEEMSGTVNIGTQTNRPLPWG